MGLSFRGIPEQAPTPYPGMAVVSSWLVPTSLDPLVATDNVDVQRLFAVVGDDGADVAAFSAYPEEREVVYLPGTLFVVGPTESMQGFEVSFVEQTDRERAPGRVAAFAIDQLRGRIDGLLASLTYRAPLALPHPGTFVGPLD